MKWWYENEEEEMKLYKNEDLCIECKNEFFSKPYDHRDPTPGQLGYCIKCDNCLIKDRKMEFDKSRIYSAVNADELKAGDKVIVADTLAELKMYVEQNAGTLEIERIEDDNCTSRFTTPNTNSWRVHFLLAYLVERAENCTNCGASPCGYRANHDIEDNKINKCPLWFQPKIEQKAKPQYRPFKDVDELIKVWCEKGGKWQKRELTMPLIWVHRKGEPKDKGRLITAFNDGCVEIGEAGNGDILAMDGLFEMCEFLDGSPCGVQE